MAARPPQEEAGETVVVRLTDVDVALRVRVADEIIRRGGLRGLAALEYQLAAARPARPAPIRVTREKADRVLRDRKQPAGPSVPVWTW